MFVPHVCVHSIKLTHVSTEGLFLTEPDFRKKTSISGASEYKNEGGHWFQFVPSPRSRDHQSYFVICHWWSVPCSPGPAAQDQVFTRSLAPRDLTINNTLSKSIQINPFVNEKIAIKIVILKTLQLSKNGIFQLWFLFTSDLRHVFLHSSLPRDFLFDHENNLGAD